jgi:hypothetical protein
MRRESDDQESPDALVHKLDVKPDSLLVRMMGTAHLRLNRQARGGMLALMVGVTCLSSCGQQAPPAAPGADWPMYAYSLGRSGSMRPRPASRCPQWAACGCSETSLPPGERSSLRNQW